MNGIVFKGNIKDVCVAIFVETVLCGDITVSEYLEKINARKREN